MTRDKFMELAARVEAATSADRELELEIWRTLNPIHAKIAEDMGKVPLEWLHCYTESLDAAMSLVPEGWRWWKATTGDGTVRTRMFVCNAADDEGRFSASGECICPETSERNAIALTAACLRAIAEDETK
jgi:hypothetical protein